MPVLRIPLAGSMVQRGTGPVIQTDATFATDQYFENCLPEVYANPITAKSTPYLTKRPGLEAAVSTVQAGATGSYGAVAWTGNSASSPPVITSHLKSGNTSMMFFNAASQIGADVPNTNLCLYMDETVVTSTAHLTASLVDSSTSAIEAWYFPEGGAWTQVTSAAISSIRAMHAHMDGYQFFMTPDGKIYNTDLNTVSSVTATNFITANSFADKGNGVTRYKNFIVGFGDYSTEFFYNAGNAVGSPLSRVANADIRIGSVRHNGAVGRVFMPVGDTVYWIGLSPETGRQGVYRLKGLTAEKVSTPNVDKFLRGGNVFIAGVFQLLGMANLMFSGGGAAGLCYCIDTNFWWRFTMGGSLTPAVVLGGRGANPEKSVLVSTGNAHIYQFTSSVSPVWQDNGVTYAMTVQTDNIDLGTNRKKYWRKLSAAYDRQASASPITVSGSDDDHASYSTLGSIDTVSTNTQSWMTRLGASRRRSWKFNHSSNTACRIQAVEIDYDVGTS